MSWTQHIRKQCCFSKWLWNIVNELGSFWFSCRVTSNYSSWWSPSFIKIGQDLSQGGCSESSEPWKIFPPVHWNLNPSVCSCEGQKCKVKQPIQFNEVDQTNFLDLNTDEPGWTTNNWCSWRSKIPLQKSAGGSHMRWPRAACGPREAGWSPLL